MNELDYKKYQLIFFRIAASITTIVFALYGPWWLFFVCVLSFSFLFSWFVEGLIVAIFHDALYSSNLSYFANVDSIMTIVALSALFAGLFMRKSVRNIRTNNF